MADLDLDEIERKAREATPGPWRRHGADQYHGTKTHIVWPHGTPKEWADCMSVARVFIVSEGGKPICDLDERGRRKQAMREAEKDAAFIAAANPQTVLAMAATIRAKDAEIERLRAGRDLDAACKPWEFSIGDPPDYESPLSGVYQAGITYAMEALAGIVGVESYTPAEGSESLEGDVNGTLRNILVTAGYATEDGDLLGPAAVQSLQDRFAAQYVNAAELLDRAEAAERERDEARDRNAKLREALEREWVPAEGLSYQTCVGCGQHLFLDEPHAPSCLLSPEAGAGDGWRPISEARVFQDEIEAARFGSDWLDEVIGDGPQVLGRRIQYDTHPGGGVTSLWNGRRLLAQYAIVRDEANWSVLTRFQPLPHAPKEKSEPDGCNIYDGGPYGDRQQEGEGNG